MENATNFYLLIAQSFVVFLNVMMLIAMALNYAGSRKPYLLLICCATGVEVLRQIPNWLLVYFPESVVLVMLTLCLQFTASCILLYGFMLKVQQPTRFQFGLLALLVGGFVVSTALLIFQGFPETIVPWYLHNLPLILLSTCLVRQSWKAGARRSPSRLFLILATSGLLFLRALIPLFPLGELFYLLYYMETLLFPMILAALLVSEVETSSAQITSLLDDRMQSEQDLQFMLDNSLDVILIADSIGLLKSWNKRAEQKFGYSMEQAIGKLHMDDLFTDNFWEKQLREDQETFARMEHIEGHSFDIGVRVKSVSRKKREYRIYVLRELDEESTRSGSMPDATPA